MPSKGEKNMLRRGCCSFPDELLIEIFNRLPAKSLVQLLCVCKSWYSLITSPDFISAYITNQQNNNSTTYHLLIDEKSSKFYVFKGNPDKFQKHTEFNSCCCKNLIVGYCDGVICMLSSSSIGDITLWNPSICKKLTLLMPCIGKKDCIFGYGKSNYDYKIVRVPYIIGNKCDRTLVSADVYVVNKGIWKIVDAYLPTSIYQVMMKGGVHVNGVIHWIVMLTMGCCSILTFSLGDEKFGEIPIPKEIPSGEFGFTLACFRMMRRDLLGLVRNGSTCGLWVMKAYEVTGSWTKVFTFDFGDMYEWGKILGVRMNGEVVLVKWNSQWFSCDPEDGTKRKLDIGRGLNFNYVGHYVESLVLIR